MGNICITCELSLSPTPSLMAEDIAGSVVSPLSVTCGVFFVQVGGRQLGKPGDIRVALR